MVHEVEDLDRLVEQLRDALESGAALLICEPKLHVPGPAFERSLRAAHRAGSRESSRPTIAFSKAALLMLA